MHLAGQESWRIGVGEGHAAHSLLFLRDSCNLAPAGADVPPPLLDDFAGSMNTSLAGSVHQSESGNSSDCVPEPGSHGHADMSEAWLRWWRRVVHTPRYSTDPNSRASVSPRRYRARRARCAAEHFRGAPG